MALTFELDLGSVRMNQRAQISLLKVV